MADVAESDITNYLNVPENAKEPIVWNIPPEAINAASIISGNMDADVIFYNGPISEPFDHRFIEACAGRVRRDNVILVLVTDGGSADSAFKMAAWLQNHYQRFTLYITGRCKSAGTLIAMGARDLVMSDNHGELGPLDVQMFAPEEPGGRRSGLTFSNALIKLDEEASLAFDVFFDGLMETSGALVSHEYTMRIASDMVVGLYGKAYAQLDPMHIGEASRALDIASRYGSRLLERGQNSDAEHLNELIASYPSHEYVIDHIEATRLFSRVYVLHGGEDRLGGSLGEISVVPHEPDEEDWGRFVPFAFLSAEPEI